MATHYLRIVVTLLGVAAAQQVCKDDLNFLADLPVDVPGLGQNGFCKDWREKYFAVAPASKDACLAAVSLSFNGFNGTMRMAAIDMQNFLATTISEGGGGCCGNSTEGASCLQFKGELPTPPCAEGQTQSGEMGVCLPCHGLVKDGECQQCWGVDTGGCGQGQCHLYGKWDEEQERCYPCNTMNAQGCGEQACNDVGGNWRSDYAYSGHCAFCRPEFGDINGCTEPQCNATGNTWVEDEFSGHCDRCAPEDGSGWACTEQQCRAKMVEFTDLNWFCWNSQEDSCLCGKCSIPDSYTYCREDQCVPTMEAMDVSWTKMKQWYYNETTLEYMLQDVSQCMRCFSDSDGSSDTQGCQDKASCDAIDGFAWADGCNASESTCCQECSSNNYWDCPNERKCSEAGQHWCYYDANMPAHGGWCGAEECDNDGNDGHAPTPMPPMPGKCTSISPRAAQASKDLGYQLRYC